MRYFFVCVVSLVIKWFGFNEVVIVFEEFGWLYDRYGGIIEGFFECRCLIWNCYCRIVYLFYCYF